MIVIFFKKYFWTIPYFKNIIFSWCDAFFWNILYSNKPPKNVVMLKKWYITYSKKTRKKEKLANDAIILEYSWNIPYSKTNKIFFVMDLFWNNYILCIFIFYCIFHGIFNGIFNGIFDIPKILKKLLWCEGIKFNQAI